MLGRIVLPVVVCAMFLFGAGNARAQAANCPANLTTANVIDHDFSVSFCELCEIGTVRLEIENPFRNNGASPTYRAARASLQTTLQHHRSCSRPSAEQTVLS
jgi:aconitase A